MDLLSHYTNRAGLEGIAQTKTLWATNILDLRDKREVLYGLVELLKVSLQAALAEVPAHKRQRTYSDADLELLEGEMYAQIRNAVAQSDRGHLYVTSFASAKVPRHNRQGIRSLWKQVGEDGYCLQFSSADIKAMVRREADLFNYALIELAPVSYVVNQTGVEFEDLRFQVMQRLLGIIARARPDVGVQPQYERFWPEAVFIGRAIQFCARHKDPYFEDEREFRILAIPADMAGSRFLRGIAYQKRSHLSSAGKRYIDIGEGWEHGIEPRRILVGPNANRDLQNILSGYSRSPEIVYVDVPENAE